MRDAASAARLLSSARQALAVSESTEDRREAFTAASLAVLRAAAAVLPVLPTSDRAKPRSTWSRLIEARPDLREWAETFERMAEFGRNQGSVITESDVTRIRQDAATFVALVADEISR